MQLSDIDIFPRFSLCEYACMNIVSEKLRVIEFDKDLYDQDLMQLEPLALHVWYLYIQ